MTKNDNNNRRTLQSDILRAEEKTTLHLPEIVPDTTVPFFNSMVTVSLFNFIKNLNGYHTAVRKLVCTTRSPSRSTYRTSFIFSPVYALLQISQTKNGDQYTKSKLIQPGSTVHAGRSFDTAEAIDRQINRRRLLATAGGGEHTLALGTFGRGRRVGVPRAIRGWFHFCALVVVVVPSSRSLLPWWSISPNISSTGVFTNHFMIDESKTSIAG